MKVRLVRPLKAEIVQVDTQATDYDPDFQEPVTARREMPPIQVPVQVEVGMHDRLQQARAGNVPDSRLVLVLDYAELARVGLVGEATLRVGDRVTRILNQAGAVIETFPNPPGLFVIEVRPTTGLGGDRNLLLAYCSDRAQSLVGGV